MFTLQNRDQRVFVVLFVSIAILNFVSFYATPLLDHVRLLIKLPQSESEPFRAPDDIPHSTRPETKLFPRDDSTESDNRDKTSPKIDLHISFSFRIDLNRAPCGEIQLLPGIGESLSEAIIAYRQENGPFLLPEEVMKIHGIGPKKYNRIKPYICITLPADYRLPAPVEQTAASTNQ